MTLLRTPICLESLKHVGEKMERAQVKEQPGASQAELQMENTGQQGTDTVSGLAQGLRYTIPRSALCQETRSR